MMEYTPSFLGRKVEVIGLYSFAKSNCSVGKTAFTNVLAGTF
ncbi:hypothetical protein P4635_20255 [Priestia megaterium]|nr:hypothetical protein [Priestia megaterium]